MSKVKNKVVLTGFAEGTGKRALELGDVFTFPYVANLDEDGFVIDPKGSQWALSHFTTTEYVEHGFCKEDCFLCTGEGCEEDFVPLPVDAPYTLNTVFTYKGSNYQIIFEGTPNEDGALHMLAKHATKGNIIVIFASKVGGVYSFEPITYSLESLLRMQETIDTAIELLA